MPGSQEAFLASHPIFEVLFEGTRGGGKSIADHTLVLTDQGWIRADKVTMKHRLVAGDGSYTSLLGIYPQERKQMYEITFSGGQKIIASRDHRWKVKSNKNSSRGWMVKTTEEIRKDFLSGWSIPYMEKAHPGKQWSGPDPYILGLIAGDGTVHYERNNITIYSVDEPILKYLEKAGWKIKRNPERSTSRAGLNLEKSMEILKWIRKSDKICPTILEADPEARLAYLQGLMDSDGSADVRASFCNNDKNLARLAADLTDSLGGRSTVNIKKYSGDREKYFYQVSVADQNKFVPFRLQRKIDKLAPQKKWLKRNIESIVPADNTSHRCFAVDHPDHTFIIEGYIVTHNTDCLLMSFGMHVGKGFGAGWKGILFRQTYKQLTDVITKTKKWFPQIWPDAKFNHSEHVWTWPGGEQLLLRQFQKADDYWNYHGHEYPWIGWEELCNWATDEGYKRMMSCCRSSTKGMPRMVRATTNPYGPGHNWVKYRFKPGVMNIIVRRDLVDDDGFQVLEQFDPVGVVRKNP